MTASNYPTTLDTNENLYQVADGLRVILAEDYNPGDTTITVEGDEEMMRRFTRTGLITLTEQCSDPELRAISFSYTARTLTTFEGLTLLSGFTDVAKPKRITNVTQNVMAAHHNNLKDAVIAIQQFAGIKGQTGLRPLEGTMEQRINYLRKIVLQPKAWFKVDKTVGLAPLKVTFTDQSFRLGTDGTSISVQHIWDFGDNTASVIPSTPSQYDSEVPSNISNVLIEDTDGGTIIKTYTKPGLYTVKLTVVNDFGSDTVVFDDLISARFPAPEFATVEFSAKLNQDITRIGQPTGGPYTTTPILRTPINTIIDLVIPAGENPYNTGYSYAGEVLDENNDPIDPIVSYTWSLGDDIPHSNSSTARAVYSVGGFYDMVLRCDTQFGSYRITTYEDAFDVVEYVNLWLWYYNQARTFVGASEFGLLSETFKTFTTGLELNRNNDFLSSLYPDTFSDEDVVNKLVHEFERNVGFAQKSATNSGNAGEGVLFWASGRASEDVPGSERVRSTSFNAFYKTYGSGFASEPVRPWNWIGLANSDYVYFVLGNTTNTDFTLSPTNQEKQKISLNSLQSLGTSTLTDSNYKNGANELQTNETFDASGNNSMGPMSVYRSTWHGDSGYFLRNQGVGQYFRIKSFYKTEGVTGEPFQNIRKLSDMAGAIRVEGQLVSLSQGVYFFSNSGAVAAYSPTTGVWGTGGPGINSPAFRNLQDTSVVSFDAAFQTLLAASDGDKTAYLSFDYSTKPFIRFNEVDTTFSSVSNRPNGDQWYMSIF
jgi:PKD repeat protein